MTDFESPFLLPPSLSCPFCDHGGSHLYDAAIGRTEWEQVECASCGGDFEIATAIDEALAEGPNWEHNLRLFGNLIGVNQQFPCRAGDTRLMDVSGVFERVIHVAYAASGTHLLGGITTQYLPNGYVMLAVAPSPYGGRGSRVDVTLSVIGQPQGAGEMKPWREMFVEACVTSSRSRRLPPILAVAAVDTFLSSEVSREVDYSELQGRPQSWNSLADEITGRSLLNMVGNPSYSLHLTEAVNVRNKLAHGGDPKDSLSEISERLEEREAEWERRIREARTDLPLAPSGEFVMSQTLAAIRAVRREGRINTRSVGEFGLVAEAG